MNDTTQRRAKLPAWITSMTVHAGLVLLLLFWVQRPPQGAAEETSREVGIVLKRDTSKGVKFDGEADALADQTADVESPNPVADTLTALPNPATESNASDALPKLPEIGAGEAGSAAGSAAQMTQGGGTLGGVRGDLGEKATPAIFGVQGEGVKFVYLFDRSASMEGAPLASAKAEFLDSLKSLAEVHQFQIIFFNNRAEPFRLGRSSRIAFATDQNKQLAKQQLGGVSASGGTDRLLALKTAIRLQPDVVFFLTDADAPMSPADLSDIATLNRRFAATICTIEFGRGPKRGGRNFLNLLAETTGGQYGYVNINRLRGGE